jgi:hypothetical protein
MTTDRADMPEDNYGYKDPGDGDLTPPLKRTPIEHFKWHVAQSHPDSRYIRDYTQENATKLIEEIDRLSKSDDLASLLAKVPTGTDVKFFHYDDSHSGKHVWCCVIGGTAYVPGIDAVGPTPEAALKEALKGV